MNSQRCAQFETVILFQFSGFSMSLDMPIVRMCIYCKKKKIKESKV